MVFNLFFCIYFPASICVQIFIPLQANLFHYIFSPVYTIFLPIFNFYLCIFLLLVLFADLSYDLFIY